MALFRKKEVTVKIGGTEFTGSKKEIERAINLAENMRSDQVCTVLSQGISTTGYGCAGRTESLAAKMRKASDVETSRQKKEYERQKRIQRKTQKAQIEVPADIFAKAAKIGANQPVAPNTRVNLKGTRVAIEDITQAAAQELGGLHLEIKNTKRDLSLSADDWFSPNYRSGDPKIKDRLETLLTREKVLKDVVSDVSHGARKRTRRG